MEPTVQEVIAQAHQTSRSKGWWDNDVPFQVWYEQYTSSPDFLANPATPAQLAEAAFEAGKKVRQRGTLIALMHSELSEALEAIRHGNPPDDKIPEFTGEEAELADCAIRMFDYAGGYNLRLWEAILAKMKMNEGRPHLHGGKHF